MENNVTSFLDGKIPSLELSTDLVGNYSIVEKIKSLSHVPNNSTFKFAGSPSPSRGSTERSSASNTSVMVDNLDELLQSLYVDHSLTLGPCLNQSSIHQLTEKDTEYVVSVTKYLYSSMFILKFSCTNTISHIQLEDLSIHIGFPNELLNLYNVKSTTIPYLKGGYDMSSTLSQDLYCVFLLKDSRDLCSVPIGSFPAIMTFSMREIDFTDGQPSPMATPDEYKVNLNY